MREVDLSTAFATRMDELCGGLHKAKIAVAVSGGADSLCLALMAHEWAKAKGLSLLTLTVDHRLRPESTDEAKQVGAWMRKHHIRHDVLTWTGKKPITRIEERAREERYRLLLERCTAEGISCLLLGHHLDDQAETVLLRLARGSGVDGLSGMKTVSMRNGIYVMRPLLTFSRDQIQNELARRKQSWIEDPSNQNDMFERVRLRQSVSAWQALGLTADKLALTAQRLGRVRDCLETLTTSFIQNSVHIHAGGFAVVSEEALASVPAEIGLRAFLYMLGVVGDDARLDQIEKAFNKLPSAMTLGGCQVVPYHGQIYVCREVSKMAAPMMLKPNQETIWDRFAVRADKPVQIASLGSALKPAHLPAKVRQTIPAFYDKKGLAGVPALDYWRENNDIKGTVIFRKR